MNVVGSMPTAFHAQVSLFASAQLLVAPNGGWNPNALWMPSDACVVEAHQYVQDSWLGFGLYLGLGELLSAIGFERIHGHFLQQGHHDALWTREQLLRAVFRWGLAARWWPDVVARWPCAAHPPDRPSHT